MSLRGSKNVSALGKKFIMIMAGVMAGSDT